MTLTALTPGQQAFYDLLCSFASEGKACPRNVELSERMGCTGAQISNYLGTFRTKGLIRTAHRGGSRTILIVASGTLIESAAHASNLTGEFDATDESNPRSRLLRDVDAEAQTQGRRRKIARSTGTVKTPVPSAMQADEPEVDLIYTDRDPCFYCGVRADAAIKCAKCAA